MTKHPIKRYVDELGGSGVFAEIYAHARVGEPGFLRKLLSRKDPELETRVKRLTETAIDVERRGGNTSDNRPIFETRKEKSEFDDVYSCLANIARDYYAAHSESREAADSRHSASPHQRRHNPHDHAPEDRDLPHRRRQHTTQAPLPDNNPPPPRRRRHTGRTPSPVDESRAHSVHPEARPRIRPTSPPPPYAPRTLNHGTTHESGVQSPHRVEHPNDQNGVIRPHQGPYRHATSSSGRNTTKREGHTSKNVRQIRSDARGSETRTTSEHTERGGRGSNTAKKTNSAAGGSTAGSTQRPRSRGSHVPDIFSKPQSVAEGSVAQSTKDEEDVAESLANLPKWGGSNQYQGPGS